jgi:hypothetical protein
VAKRQPCSFQPRSLRRVSVVGGFGGDHQTAMATARLRQFGVFGHSGLGNPRLLEFSASRGRLTASTRLARIHKCQNNNSQRLGGTIFQKLTFIMAGGDGVMGDGVMMVFGVMPASGGCSCDPTPTLSGT